MHQFLDDSTQLYAFDFRYYDPLIGRFITPDPDREPVQKPDRLNRYSYVANNPLTLMDPLGLSDADPNAIDTAPDITLTYRAAQSLPVTYVEAPPVNSTEGESGAISGNGIFGFWNGGFDRSTRVDTADNKLTVNFFGGQWGHIGNAINSGQSLGLYPAGSIPFFPNVGAPFLTEGRFAADAEMQGAGPTISVTFRINAAQAARAERAIRGIQVDPSNFNALSNNCTTSTESVLRAAGIANVPTTIFPAQLIRELPERNDVTVTFPHPSPTPTSIQLVPK